MWIKLSGNAFVYRTAGCTISIIIIIIISVSMTPVLGMVVTPWSGLLVERVGPSRLLFLFFSPALVLWLVMAFAPYLWLLYLCRVGIAISSALISIIVQPLVAELSPPRIRGLLCTVPQMMHSLGMLAAFILAQFTPWYMTTAALAAILAPLAILLFFVPEV